MIRYSAVFFAAICLAFVTHGETLAQDLYFDSSGVQIHYTDQGEGETVVLLHGITGDHDVSWERPGVTAALLDAGFRVINYDNRGHGKSDKPYSTDMYGMEMVHDLGRLLDHLGIQRVHVVGYSMGARIAHKFRTIQPERYLSLTLGGYGWGHAALSQLSANPTESEMRSLLISNGRTEGNDARALAAVYSSLPEWDLDEDAIRSNEVPTLIINGDEDDRRIFAEQMLGIMPDVEHVLVSGTHGSAPSDPRFAEVLVEFLEKHAAQ